MQDEWLNFDLIHSFGAEYELAASGVKRPRAKLLVWHFSTGESLIRQRRKYLVWAVYRFLINLKEKKCT